MAPKLSFTTTIHVCYKLQSPRQKLPTMLHIRFYSLLIIYFNANIRSWVHSNYILFVNTLFIAIYRRQRYHPHLVSVYASSTKHMSKGI